MIDSTQKEYICMIYKIYTFKNEGLMVHLDTCMGAFEGKAFDIW